MLPAPLSEIEYSLMQEKSSKAKFIDAYITGNQHSNISTVFTRLRSFNFIAEDFVGTNMPLDRLQTVYSVERLQKAGFVLKELIEARQKHAITVFKPLIETSRKGGLLGRIYTESIQVDFARQLLSAGMTPDQLHTELKTNQLPLSSRFVTNLHILQARALNAISGNQQNQVALSTESSPPKPVSAKSIGRVDSDNSLASTASLSSRGSTGSNESQPEDSPHKSVP